jgi:prolyl-tRNA synthetase
VVQADSGAIGGSSSEEFMAACDIGEDTLLIAGDYAANAERAISELPELPPEAPKALEVVETPGANTIAKLCQALEITPERTLKTLIYTAAFEDREEAVAVLIRGDKDINEVKLLNHLGALTVKLADEATVTAAAGGAAGYVGPTTLAGNLQVLADETVRSMSNFAAGCGEAGKHAVNVNHGRDFPTPDFTDLRQAVEGEIAPNGKPLEAFKGIEVGHIFKLGDQYSSAMKAGVNDKEGKFRHFQMGCYGVGSTRIASAIVEQYHDERGITWPTAIAPFHVHLTPMKYQDPAVKTAVDQVMAALEARGLEVLLDDRNASAGVKFADADAIGVPYRITFGRGLAAGKVELRSRRDGETRDIALEEIGEAVASAVKADLEASGNLPPVFG